MENIKKKVIIIDYQLGNLFSVKQACDTIGINAEISSDREDILNADALILPGVGAFIEAMTVAHQAVQAMGGMGFMNETPVARIFRDAKLMEIGAGTSEIRRMLIGRELMGAMG